MRIYNISCDDISFKCLNKKYNIKCDDYDLCDIKDENVVFADIYVDGVKRWSGFVPVNVKGNLEWDGKNILYNGKDIPSLYNNKNISFYKILGIFIIFLIILYFIFK